jgi:hypothetical protein
MNTVVGGLSSEHCPTLVVRAFSLSKRLTKKAKASYYVELLYFVVGEVSHVHLLTVTHDGNPTSKTYQSLSTVKLFKDPFSTRCLNLVCGVLIKYEPC